MSTSARRCSAAWRTICGSRSGSPGASGRSRRRTPRSTLFLTRRIWPLEAAHTEETVYWSAMLGAAELLLGGTTAVLDMETVRHTAAAFKALERIGIRATVGKCLMDVHPEGAPIDLVESTDDALADAAALAQSWHGAAAGRL